MPGAGDFQSFAFMEYALVGRERQVEIRAGAIQRAMGSYPRTNNPDLVY